MIVAGRRRYTEARCHPLRKWRDVLIDSGYAETHALQGAAFSEEFRRCGQDAAIYIRAWIMIGNANQLETQQHLLQAHRSEEILSLVYDQLRQLAESRLANEACCHSMQATALVHEVYLRLTERDPKVHWNSRNHFFGAAAIAMRRILVERARKRKTLRRGRDFVRQPLTEMDRLEAHLWNQKVNILELNDALEKLAEHSARQARVVELRFLLGMTNKEAAEVLGISTATADLDWRYARSYLQLELFPDGS